MKKIKQNMMFLITLFALVMLNACELEETNINPNKPTVVPAKVLLPFIESGIADLMGGSNQAIPGIFMQYYKGEANWGIPAESYILNEGQNVQDIWSGYYTGPMMNLRKMIDIAEKDKSYYYTGVGKVLMAICLGNLTSLWGDVPYSNALTGSGNLNPKYDPQQSIYESIQQLLDDAIIDLQKTYVGLKPGTDDIIYGGNATKWVKAAYALKARYYIHLTKRASDLTFNPWQKALDAVGSSMASSAEDLEYSFTYSVTEYNSFYELAGLKYFLLNPNMMGLMGGDPRSIFYFPGFRGEYSIIDNYFTSKNSPQLMITYHEIKFIEAEARLHLNASDPQIQVALQNAVSANMSKVSKGTIAPTDITNFINANVVLSGTVENKLKTIITQKYIALYASTEPWSDYRRTGYPELVPNSSGNHNQNPGGNIPRRLNYPLNERVYNPNFPYETTPDLQTRFWWDL